MPVGIGEVTVTANLDTDDGPDQFDRLAALTKRYWVVGQSLRTPLRFVVQRV